MSKWYFTNRDDEGLPDKNYVLDELEKDILDCIIKFKMNRLTSGGKFPPRYGLRQKYLFGCLYGKKGIYHNMKEREKLEPKVIKKLDTLLDNGIIYRCWYRNDNGDNYPYWHTDVNRLGYVDISDLDLKENIEDIEGLQELDDEDFKDHEIEEEPLDMDDLGNQG